PLRIESSAITRRNSTSRRVQTLSSDSARSDEIAATDMALSRAFSLAASLALAPSRAASRVEISDMAPFWLLRPAKSIGCHPLRQGKARGREPRELGIGKFLPAERE